jgi:hypothetical protein
MLVAAGTMLSRLSTTIGEVAQRCSTNKTRVLLALLFVVLLQFHTLHLDQLFLPHKNGHQDDGHQDENDTGKIFIFYNLFIGNKKDIPRIRTLIHEQFQFWNATRHGGVQVTSIGVDVSSRKKDLFPLGLPIRRLTHEPTGSELLTLDALWGLCQDHPSTTVAYLHSKGSFHAIAANDVMRRLLTEAALSQDCFNSVVTTRNYSTTDGDNSENDPTTLCNTCSFRMSPFPHLHTPGNMWSAQCTYVRHLLKPSVFSQRMDELYKPWSSEPDSGKHCVGVGRFAAEHWLHTHPYNRPCDLCPHNTYSWGYAGLPKLPLGDDWTGQNWNVLQAPRFDNAIYLQGKLCLPMNNFSRVLDQFQRLYQLTPAHDWWGWSWYNDTAATT